MDTNIYAEIKKEYAEKRKNAQLIADSRREELYNVLPELREYDRKIFSLSHSLVGSMDKADDILKEMEYYIKCREQAIVSAGYPKDYTNPPYECPHCSDTGYSGTEMCSCMKKRIQLESLKYSGLGKLAQTQDFDNFSFDYYNGNSLYFAQRHFDTLKNFACSFDSSSSDNFLLIGGTGLGKTHLSTSVAKKVIENGFEVVYTTAIRMVETFETKRFSAGMQKEGQTDKFYECDLLIIDDLGCEMSTQYTLSVVYDLINTRLNDGKPTIVSTNLSADELRKKYDDRITSRLFGNYSILPFTGTDIRQQKLMK